MVSGARKCAQATSLTRMAWTCRGAPSSHVDVESVRCKYFVAVVLGAERRLGIYAEKGMTQCRGRSRVGAFTWCASGAGAASQGRKRMVTVAVLHARQSTS